MIFQTCRRHPKAGRFLATCPGCAQELYDIAERNRALAAAAKALAAHGMDGARIIDAAFAHDALIVSTNQPDAYLPYAVDVFRLPTPAETDPEQIDPRTPGEWILIDQHGDHTADAVPGMVASARTYLTEIGIIPAPLSLTA